MYQGQTGTSGAGGTKASPSGGAGQNVKLINHGNGADASNTTTADGGAGGGGYPGGGAGGNGGYGYALTVANPQVNTASRVYAVSSAGGGDGGNGSVPTDPFLGGSATGGAGGNSYAAAYAANTLGPTRATGTSTGGSGGASIGSGVTGGAAGIATLGTIVAKGTSAYAKGYQTGGSGAEGIYGANGANGASSNLTNQVSGSSTGGYLRLKQEANGGAGGNSYGGTAGQAGYGKSYLTFNDTTNAKTAGQLYGYSSAQGGNAGGYLGHGTSAAIGGAATSSIDLLGDGQASATVKSQGGLGGSASNWSKTNLADANGGEGGTATVTHASVQTGLLTASQTAGIEATATGGTGGEGAGAGNSGGAGGAAQLSPVSARGHAAGVTAIQQGGNGGNGISGASSGNGASSTLTNDVSGYAAGGSLSLNQTAKGGYGGVSYGGTAGNGGNGTSNLTFTDTAETPAATLRGNTYAYGGGGGSGMLTTKGAPGANATANLNLYGAYAVYGRADAERAGSGGSSGPMLAGAMGGTATSSANVASTTTGSNKVESGAQAYGGAGGNAYGTGVGGSGGQGGPAAGSNAAGYSKSAPDGYAAAGATQKGGTGGTGRGAGYIGGAGGTASGTTATAQAHNAKAIVHQTGGGGGAGRGLYVNGVINSSGTGASGGAGANSKLNDAATGKSTGGFLYLDQYSTGGSGGSGYANGGAAGYGDTTLAFDDTANPQQASMLRAKSYGTGGNGGNSGLLGGGTITKVPTGGTADTQLIIKGANAVYAQGGAAGGAGGSVFSGTMSGGAGGFASGDATAKSTTTSGSNRVGATLDITGGQGGEVDGSTGNGGQGGPSDASYVGAYEPDATSGGRAAATLTQIGGAGGAAFNAGSTGGAGGLVFVGGEYAAVTAYGYNAVASLSQTGGVGGNGMSGASGGNGANAYVSNQVAGKTKGGYLYLTQSATGGGGGSSAGGTAGTAGYGKSYLHSSDKTATVLKGSVYAVGGAGGSGTGTSNSAAGGAATAKENLTGANSTTAKVGAGGGEAGSTGGTGIAGAGGAATASATAITTATGNSLASATASSEAGAGGGVTVGHTGSGGAGGKATGSTAAATTKGTGEASAYSVDTGGTGGIARGGGQQGGTGGSVSTTTASASGGLAIAHVKQAGGAGGYGGSGAAGGLAASSNLKNAVTATTSGGPLTLTQTATGGAGGGSNASVAANGAYGYSYLKFSAASVGTTPSSLTGTAGGYGGAGGFGTGGSDGASGAKGYANVQLTSATDIIATAIAKGGAGGASSVLAGGGGNALAIAAATTTSSASNGTATADAAATGGTGTPVGGAVAQSTASTPNGQEALSEATADGAAANAQTDAITTTASSSDLLSVSATTSDNTMGSVALSSTAADGATGPLLDGDNDYSFAVGDPNAIFISSVMKNNAAIANVLGTVDTTATILGYGVAGGVAEATTTGSQEIITTQTYTINPTSIGGDLVLGLVGNQADGAGFTDLDFIVDVNGTQAINEDFATVASAQAYFNDQAVTLEALPTAPPANLAVTITLDVTSDSSNGGFGASFLLGATGENGPPVIGVADPSVVIGQNVATTIPGLSVSETGDTTGEGFTVKLTDTMGLLSASSAGGATVSGTGTTALTISGSLTQVNAALGTVTDTSAAGSDTIDVNATDNDGGSATQQSVAVTINGLPVIAVPSSVALRQGVSGAASGFGLSETGSTAGETFNVKLTDTNGLLNATSFGATLNGANTTVLTISGSLSEVVQALNSVTDKDGTGTSDTITVSASDSLGNTAQQQIVPVTVAGPLSITVPATTQTDGEIGETALSSVEVVQNGAGNAESFSVTLSDAKGLLGTTSPGTASVTGEGTTSLKITGGLAEVNDALAGLADTETSLANDTISVNASDAFGDSAGPSTIAVQVFDTPAAIAGLAPAAINTLVANGVTTLRSGGDVFLPATLASELGAAGISVSAPLVAIKDSAADIELLSTTSLGELPAVGVELIESNDTTIAFNFNQGTTLAPTKIPVSAPNGQVTVTGTAAQISALTTTAIGNFQSIGVTGLVASDASVTLSLMQAQAMLGVPAVSQTIRVSAPANDTVTILDAASAIEGLSPTTISALNGMGASSIDSNDGSYFLTVAQAEASVSAIFFAAPAGGMVTIQDRAANIVGLLNSNNAAQELGNIISYDSISGLIATDAPVVLTVAEAEAAENPGGLPPVPISSLTGSVTLADTAANIEAMSATQLGELTTIGVTGVTVTDESLTLTVAQALALFDPVPITVPNGDTVTVADSETDVDMLTPAQVAGLASIGVTDIAVPSLTGAAPLTIEGGITLSVAGAISPAQTITFAGTGGTLALADPVDNQGTVAGFAVPDRIDLTGGANDGSATASLGASNLLTVSEVSGTYNIQLDQAQFFPSANFVPSPDAGTGTGTGTGTNVNIVQVPITSYIAVPSGRYVDGALIAAGGYVDVQSGGTLNAGTIDAGGLLQFEPGAAGDGIEALGEGGTVDVFSQVGLGDGLVVVDQPGAFTGTIQNFTDDTTLYLPNETVDDPVYNGSAITFTDGSDDTISLSTTGGLDVGPLLAVPDGHGGFFVGAASDPGLPCFLAGTRIATPRGEVRVERLAVGDLVLTESGAQRPIVWIGMRSIECMRQPVAEKVWPVRVTAGAFGAGRPARDLFLSPDHAVFVDGVLVPVKLLANGRNIVQVRRRKAAYYHIELETHDVLLADLLPVESYLDTGDRSNFANGCGPVRLHPDFSTRVWEAKGCAPLVVTGPILAGIRARLLQRPARLPSRADRAGLHRLNYRGDTVRQ